MNNFALIKTDNGVVVNVIQWDGRSKWDIPSGHQLVQSAVAGIGWTYIEGMFTPPVQEELTKDDLIFQAEQTKQRLKANADAEIAWRQDAVDKNMATDAETVELDDWKKYRVMLMRADTSTAPDINWPQQPTE